VLPGGWALVLEGGGVRGFYSSGVFEAFMDAGIMFPYIAGVSAGAANALSYISGQRGRSRILIEKYVGSRRYQSPLNLPRHRSLFGFDFIFNTIPGRHIFWDRDVYDETAIRFLTGALDADTGKTVWFEKDTLGPDYITVRASCSIPVVSRIVKHNGLALLDGGISLPHPHRKIN
jgi:predicted patatin/cPLA2 family phospholipase